MPKQASKLPLAILFSCAFAGAMPNVAQALEYRMRVASPGVKGPTSPAGQQGLPAQVSPAAGALVARESADFGAVPIGTSVQRIFDLTNQGGEAATNIFLALQGAGVSSVSNSCGTPGSPITLASGVACSVTLAYAPTSESSLQSANLSFAGSFSNSPVALQLAGSGYWQPVSFLEGSISSAWGGATLAATNTALSTDGTTWTVNARPAGQTGQSVYAKTGASSARGRVYAEFSSTTSSAWFLVDGATSGVVTGVALDGPGCTQKGTYVASCTSYGSSSANARFGVLLDYAAGTLTFYKNGSAAMVTSGINVTENYRLFIQDRDVPANSASRIFRIYTQPSSWLYAPQNVIPFRK